MKKMGGVRTLLFSCFTGSLFIYLGFCILSMSLNATIVVLIGAVATFGILTKLCVPAAEDSTVVRMFGPDQNSNKSDSGGLETIDVKNVQIVAHRACGLDSPENSMSALKKVIKEGIIAVEYDVMLTKDDVPIVFHDETLTRMTFDSRKVGECTYQQLSSLDISVAHPFGKMYSGERIPTLTQFVECCIENNVRMFLDLKCSGSELVPHIIKIYQEFPQLHDLAVITSFNPLLIYKIRSQNPMIIGCLAWRRYFYSYLEYSGSGGPTGRRSSNLLVHLYYRFLDIIHYYLLWHFIYYVLGISAICLHKDMITGEIIQHWRKRRVRVFAWTVNLPSEKAYFEKCLRVPYLTDTVISS